MVKLLDFKGSGGLVSGETLMNEMKKLIGEHQIESLSIAVNLVGDIDLSLTEIVEDKADTFHAKVIEYLKDIAIPDTFTS